MKENKRKEIVLNLIKTFEYAGEIALNLRKQGLIKKIKEDNTPVSNGDIEVNNILTEKIFSLTPEIPIISEETIENKDNKNLNNFWLIDPIDGTYDYINNKDEFTINAALIINKKPVIGIINAQTPTSETVSKKVLFDSIPQKEEKKPLLLAEVQYTAKDCVQIDRQNNKLILFNEAELYYQDIELRAGIIIFTTACMRVFGKTTIDAGRSKLLRWIFLISITKTINVFLLVMLL